MAERDPRVIGTRIARRRHQLGWTQVELAGRLSVSPSTVANWERGASYPKKKFGKVEQVLGISLDSEQEQPPPVSRSLEAAMRAELGDELASALIAHAGRIATGRTAPQGAAHPPESSGRGRRTAG